MLLKGKVALVTGAASGMGRAIAVRFAKEGAAVAAVDIMREGGEQTCRLIKDLGGDAAFVRCDVSKRDDAREAVASTIRRFGKLHILVNCAGIFDPMDGNIADLAEATWDRVMGVNLKGPFYLCKYSIPEIITCGGGVIINIASVAGLTATLRPAYGASKGALIAMTRAVARQYGAQKVRAIAICPGPIETPLLEAARKAREDRDPNLLAKPVMLGRAGHPEEVAEAALFLASEDASYITAAVFPVDGGQTAV